MSNIINLPEAAAVADTDLIYSVKDPSGTPSDVKVPGSVLRDYTKMTSAEIITGIDNASITDVVPASDDKIITRDTSDAGKTVAVLVSDLPISTATQTALDNKLETSLKGANDGLAELGSDGKVPAAQLPEMSGGGLEWSVATGNKTGQADEGYIFRAPAGATLLLPGDPAEGTKIGFYIEALDAGKVLKLQSLSNPVLGEPAGGEYDMDQTYLGTGMVLIYSTSKGWVRSTDSIVRRTDTFMPDSFTAASLTVDNIVYNSNYCVKYVTFPKDVVTAFNIEMKAPEGWRSSGKGFMKLEVGWLLANVVGSGDVVINAEFGIVNPGRDLTGFTYETLASAANITADGSMADKSQRTGFALISLDQLNSVALTSESKLVVRVYRDATSSSTSSAASGTSSTSNTSTSTSTSSSGSSGSSPTGDSYSEDIRITDVSLSYISDMVANI